MTRHSVNHDPSKSSYRASSKTKDPFSAMAWYKARRQDLKKKTKRSHRHDVAFYRQRSQSYLGDLFSEHIQVIPQVNNGRSGKTEHGHSVTVNGITIADKHEILCSPATKIAPSPKIAEKQDRKLVKGKRVKAVNKANKIARLKINSLKTCKSKKYSLAKEQKRGISLVELRSYNSSKEAHKIPGKETPLTLYVETQEKPEKSNKLCEIMPETELTPGDSLFDKLKQYNKSTEKHGACDRPSQRRNNDLDVCTKETSKESELHTRNQATLKHTKRSRKLFKKAITELVQKRQALEIKKSKKNHLDISLFTSKIKVKPCRVVLSDVSLNISAKARVDDKTKSDEETIESSLSRQTSTNGSDSEKNDRHFLDIFATSCDSTSSMIPLSCDNKDKTKQYPEENFEHNECSTEENLSSEADFSRKLDSTADCLNCFVDRRKQDVHDAIYSDISDEESGCNGMDVVHSYSSWRTEDIREEPKDDTDESENEANSHNDGGNSDNMLLKQDFPLTDERNDPNDSKNRNSLLHSIADETTNTVTLDVANSPIQNEKPFRNVFNRLKRLSTIVMSGSESDSDCEAQTKTRADGRVQTKETMCTDARLDINGNNSFSDLVVKSAKAIPLLSSVTSNHPSSTLSKILTFQGEISASLTSSSLVKTSASLSAAAASTSSVTSETAFPLTKASVLASILLPVTQEVSSEKNVAMEQSPADRLNNSLTPSDTVTSSPVDLSEFVRPSFLDMDRPSKDLIFNNFPVRGRKRRIRFRRTSNLVMNISSSMEIASDQKQRLCPLLNDTNILPDVQKLPPLPDSYQTFIESLNEEGSFDLEQAFQFLDYSSYSIPKLVTGLMFKYGILDPKVSVVNFNRSCQMLQEVCARTPGCVDLNWEVVGECLRQLTSSQSFPDRRQRQVRLLEFLVNIIKVDLRGHLSDMAQMPTALAYRLLAFSVANSNRKELVNFLGKCLQYECFTDDNIKKKVIHLVQTLLTLCVEVSSSCVDCTNGLSQELKLLYTDLPAGDSGRPLLLNSISSPLLSLKLCQLLLETQYTDTRSVDTLGLPESLAEIRRAYFQAIPIKTPMSAESDSSYEEEEKEAQRDTEELCNIILTCVTSFLQVAIGNYEKPLRLREPRATSGMWNMTERQDFRDHVDRLEEHLRSLSPNLSQQCEYYLARLQILVDAD